LLLFLIAVPSRQFFYCGLIIELFFIAKCRPSLDPFIP
jgi:hypothetical protein